MGPENGVVLAVIPARWGSTRFPGKPLADLVGEPMVVHVARRAASAASVDEVLVATDDERIASAVRAAGFDAVLTGECPSGTDRVAAALANRTGWRLVLNLQGDEPLLSGANVDALVAGMDAMPVVGIGTLCRPLPRERSADPNAVKVVRDLRGLALYFSRAPIPHPRDAETAQGLARLHLGIYAYRPGALARFVSLPPSALERAEGLEQLRALENGLDILVIDAPHESWGVDTPEDLRRAAGALAQH